MSHVLARRWSHPASEAATRACILARARFCAAGCQWLRSVAPISFEDDICNGRALTVVPIMPFEWQLLSDEVPGARRLLSQRTR